MVLLAVVGVDEQRVGERLGVGQRAEARVRGHVLDLRLGELRPLELEAVLELRVDAEQAAGPALVDGHVAAGEADEVRALGRPADRAEGHAEITSNASTKRTTRQVTCRPRARSRSAYTSSVRGANSASLGVGSRLDVGGGAPTRRVCGSSASAADAERGPVPVVDHVHDHAGDVVPTAVVVGLADQVVGDVGRVGQAPHRRRDLVGVDLVEQAVGAQQEPVALVGEHRARVDEDLRVDAEGTGDDVALRVDRGLVVGDLAVPLELGHQVVVVAELDELVVAEQVDARVADVDPADLLLTVVVLEQDDARTASCPCPAAPGRSTRCVRMWRLASSTPATSASRVGSVTDSSSVRTAIADATSPPWWPPMPSATANSGQPSLMSGSPG